MILIRINSVNMYHTSFLFRFAKAILVADIGLMAALIVIGNTTDYYTNYLFVEHVMKMDTTFSVSHVHYRSINNPLFFHTGYIIIIVMEMLMADCSLKGSWLLFKSIRKVPRYFMLPKIGQLRES
jgi:predicted small integral membrane protein